MKKSKRYVILKPVNDKLSFNSIEYDLSTVLDADTKIKKAEKLGKNILIYSHKSKYKIDICVTSRPEFTTNIGILSQFIGEPVLV